MQPTDHNFIEELRAEMQGIRANVEMLDVNMRRWRDVTSNAFNLLTQREAKEDGERKGRQKRLDRWLWCLTGGVAVCLLLLIVLLSVFIGSQIGKGG